VASLVDTNVLVYRFDPRFPEKQRVARELLHRGLVRDELTLPHQAILEFVAVVTRPRKDLGGAPLLEVEEAHREAEELMKQFPVLYPDEEVLITALRGASTYRLAWFDAHLWAYAEVHGLPEIVSEDFEHGRHYGSVRVVDPFLSAAGNLHELPAMYGDRGRS
jgi:predicted nucleic acid-binding protein